MRPAASSSKGALGAIGAGVRRRAVFVATFVRSYEEPTLSAR
jgi:hypothetical protein